MTERDIELLRLRFKLTDQESRMLTALMAANSTVNRTDLLRAVTAGFTINPHIKIVDVLACRVRAKIKTALELGANERIIETVWGRGYRIEEAMKDLVRAQLAPPAIGRAA